ncbi:hypothetical protein D9V84_03805 [Bacteroidetes/Chlorobi group bacterium Naka2016]|jgi:hypothetical protein|nr:MAG: hypothetical protein D9V84_03805 [Bacteroidetes/Chlorobi group bacterium Naka2016]
MKRQKLFNNTPLQEGQVVLFRNFFVWRKSFQENVFCSSARNELAQGIEVDCNKMRGEKVRVLILQTTLS